MADFQLGFNISRARTKDFQPISGTEICHVTTVSYSVILQSMVTLTIVTVIITVTVTTTNKNIENITTTTTVTTRVIMTTTL